MAGPVAAVHTNFGIHQGLKSFGAVCIDAIPKASYTTLILQIKPPGTHIDIINWQSQIANYLNQADADDEDVVEQVWSLTQHLPVSPRIFQDLFQDF